MSKAKFNAKKFERPGLTEDEIEEIVEQEKKEISCPDCAQSLRVPTDYSGSVRCPACKVVFGANSE